MARDFLYIEEVARECRTGVSSVRAWISSGRLRSIRPGRRLLVAQHDLDAFLASTAQQPRQTAHEHSDEEPRP